MRVLQCAEALFGSLGSENTYGLIRHNAQATAKHRNPGKLAKPTSRTRNTFRSGTTSSSEELAHTVMIQSTASESFIDVVRQKTLRHALETNTEN